MTSGEPPRWQRLAWRRVASVAGVVLVTAVLLALGVSRDRADETEPPVAAPATTPAAAPVASPPLTPSAPATLPPSRTPPASVTPPASATPSASVTASPATGLLPVVSVSPGGPEVPRLATLTVSFRDPPRETAGARLVSIAPAVDGSFAWADDRTLVFQPAFPGWQRGQRYELSVSASAAGIARDHRHAFTVEGRLEVSYVIPADGDTEVPVNAQVLVQFNRSVAALTVLQEGPAPPVLEFDPPLAGTGEWLNTSLYRFIPTEIRPSTHYRVRIPAGLTSAADGVLESDISWSFSTIWPAITGTSPHHGTVNVEPDSPITVSFNQRMDRASVEAELFLRSRDGKVIPSSFEWDHSAAEVTLRPDQPLALSSSYSVTAPAGLLSATGGVTRSERVARFTTINPPRLESTRPADGATRARLYEIRLFYNNPMDVESFVDRVSISGIDREDIWVHGGGYDEYASTVWVAAPLQYSTEYTVRVALGVRDRGGRAAPSAEFSFTTVSYTPTSFATPAVTGNFLTWSADRPQTLYYHAARVDEVRFRLYSLSEAEAELLLRRGQTYDYQNGQRVYFQPESAPIREWSEEIREDWRDARRIYSTTLNDSEPLPRGDYFLRLGGARLVLSVVDTSIVTKLTHDELLVWALDYESGEPLANVEVRAADAGHPYVEPYRTATTDRDGLARFDISPYQDHVVRVDGGARNGVTTTRWDEGSGRWQLGVYTTRYVPRLLGNVYTDRPIYRPGETVYYKGVVRDENDASYSIPAPSTQLDVAIWDPHYEELASTTVQLNEWGTFASEFVIPEGATTGTYRVRLARGNGLSVTSTSFTVAEYRKPEFEVWMETGRADYIDGEQIDVATHASFFFGGPVAGADVEWSTNSSPTTFRAPGYGRYSFSDRYSTTSSYSEPPSTAGVARTDILGVGRFDVAAQAGGAGRTEVVAISATVVDQTAQAVASSTTTTVHPAAWYAGIRPESYVATVGEQEPIHLATVDVWGQVAPGKGVTVRIYERTWITTKERLPGGRRVYRSEVIETEVERQSATTNAAGRASVTFTPPSAGTFRLVAETADDRGRVARGSRLLWVSAGETRRHHASWRVRNDDVIELIADRDGYEVGDIAEVLVPAPFAGSAALITIERGGVLSTEVRVFETNSEVLRIPIEDAHLPNIYVGVVLYRAPTAADPLPRYQLGYVSLPVSTAPRRLDVTIEPDRDRAFPGETMRYEVQVTDWRGLGVESEVSVAIVDKALLALADEVTRDGLRAFWYQRGLGVRTASSLAVSVDRRNDAYSETEQGGKGGDGGGDYAFGGTYVRANFESTALWIGQLSTDENGRASFEVPLPDNATTWRAQARAVSGSTQVGRGESELLVTQPLLLRPALPRFLRVGDEVTLRTLVRNGTGETSHVTVALEADGVVINESCTITSAVPSDRSTAFAWSARVLEPGEATFRFFARAPGGYQDAVEISIPVYLDVTPETTATGGVIDGGVALETVYLPDYVITGSGSLKLLLQASLVGALDTELPYLAPEEKEGYVYVASRVVATTAVQRASAAGLTAGQERQLRADIATLVSGQRYDGGWPWCRTCGRTSLWATAWVLVALGEAADAGHSVPAPTLAKTAQMIANYINRPPTVEREPNHNLEAYLLYALAIGSNRDGEVSALARAQGATMRALVEQHRSRLTSWGRAYLLLGLLASGHAPDHGAVRALLNDLTATTIASANGNHWQDDRHAGSMHNGSVRSTALVLRALAKLDPRHPLIEETARWLVIARSENRWKTSVARAQGMASLGAFSELTGEHRGVYDYRVLLNTREVLAGDFDVPRRDYQDGTVVALEELPLGEVSRVQFERDATREGRMYYALNLRYLTPAQEIEALNRGFGVSHRYSLLDHPDQSITSAALGDVIRVAVTVVAPADRLYARIDDFLPAGLEPIDTGLNIVSDDLREQLEQERYDAVAASAPEYYAPWYGWYFNPWDQVDLRDDRLTLLASRLPKGVHEYVYFARATAPGDFYVAPTVAAETYFPEVFGRSDSGRFTVEPGERAAGVSVAVDPRSGSRCRYDSGDE